MATGSGIDARAEPWRYVGTAGNPAFENGWDNVAIEQRVRFRRVTLAGGAVYVDLGGVAARAGQTAVANPIFTLPDGYRPPTHEWHPIVVANGVTLLQVTTAGAVNVSASGGTGTATPTSGVHLWAVRVIIA